MKLMIGFGILMAGIIGFGVVMVATHHTTYDHNQRQLDSCHAKGLDMVEDYSQHYVCVRTTKP